MVPFNDLLLSTALEVHGSWIGFHLSRGHVPLSPFFMPRSPQRADAHMFGLLLQILSRSVPMLPSLFVFGSRSDPRCQLNAIKISMTESRGFINTHHFSFPIHM